MSNFNYYNANPEKYDEEDCVCRAISIATQLDYKLVDKLLGRIAEKYQCDKLCVCCYKHLLTDILGYKMVYCYNGETIGEVALQHPYNVCVIRTIGHLTISVYGKVRDSFDCTMDKADRFWIIA